MTISTHFEMGWDLVPDPEWPGEEALAPLVPLVRYFVDGQEMPAEAFAALLLDAQEQKEP
jgi:hypothetical protein